MKFISRRVYSVLITLLAPVLLFSLWRKSKKNPAYLERWQERFGVAPAPVEKQGKRVWFHTVSVGETIAAAPLIELCLADPEINDILVTTTTPTGSDRVKAIFGSRVHHVYCPWDISFAVKRFIRTWQPDTLVVMETELWPNILHFCHKAHIQTVLANGRMSEKSAKGYAKLPLLTSSIFSNLDRVLVQNDTDAQRILKLGAENSQVEVCGSVKFDIAPTDDQIAKAAAMREFVGQRFLWVAASTHPGEDEKLLKAHSQLLEQAPEALLLIVPRHPERFTSVGELAAESFKVQRRSMLEPVDGDTQVLLGDTMGEMMVFFGACDAAFVGGSLVPHGGHNVLEPASWAIPVLSGAHVHNFKQICEQMVEQGALISCADEDALGSELIELAMDESLRDVYGAHAKEYLDRNRGSLERQYQAIIKL